jgi:sugar transferase EpsL
MGPLVRASKRSFDVVASALALLVLAVPMLIIGAAVRLGSRGSTLFRQERAGKDMKPFTLYKFRTMRTEADPFGVSPTGGDDARLTRIGRWLRETSLDELPQLWNVLQGDMSLVGPRPLYLSQAREFNDRQRRRLEVKPGLTGMAQVSGRGNLPHDEKLELDVQYVENAGFRLDLKILFRTAAMVVRRKQVYQRW